MSDDLPRMPRRPIEPRRNDAGMRFDPDLAFDRPELKALLDIWQAKRGDRALPTRSDLDPLDLRDHLGHLLLVDVERSPLRFRYRLVGTKITAILQRDVTGRYFEEIYAGQLLDELTEAFSIVAETRAPLRIFSNTGHPRNQIYLYDCVLLPLSVDGVNATLVLGEMRFTPESAARRAKARSGTMA